MSEPIYPSSRHDRPHARFYDHDAKHPAWKELSENAFKLIMCLLARYRPNKPNSFAVGGKTVAEMICVSERTAPALVDELIEKGHLHEERKGRNRGSVRTRERVVSLTRFHTDLRDGDPSLPEKVWKEKMKAQNLQGREHAPAPKKLRVKKTHSKPQKLHREPTTQNGSATNPKRPDRSIDEPETLWMFPDDTRI